MNQFKGTPRNSERSMKVALMILAVAGVLATATLAQGQYGAPPYYGYGGFYGGGGGWGSGAGSTAAGSYLAGLGQSIRAAGQYNLYSSEAAVNLEQASKQDIENRLQWTNTYFEMRKINQAYQQSQKAPPGNPTTWARLAQQAAPKRMTPDELDPVTGTLNWPSVLQEEMYRPERDQLDQLFADRAMVHGAIGYPMYTNIRNTVDSMHAKLKGQIRAVNSKFYIEANNFLTSLAREAEFPANPSPGEG
jgi:hypothetical protein